MDDRIIMELDNYVDVAPLKVPEEYELTTIISVDDEKQWEKLIGTVFNFPCNIEKNLKNEDIYSPNRVFLLKHNGNVIATASAWYRKEFGDNVGYLHMVAVDENYRGKGLSKYVVSEALLFMINEKRDKIVLKTDKFREAAINTYIKFGFKVLNK